MHVENNVETNTSMPSAKNGRPFKAAASDGLGSKRRLAFMAVSTVLVLAVGALTLSGITHDMGQTPGEVALTVPETQAEQTTVAQQEPQPVVTPEGEAPMTLASLDSSAPGAIPSSPVTAGAAVGVETKPYVLGPADVATPQVQPMPQIITPAVISNEELNAKMEALIVMTGELQNEIKSMKSQVGVIARNSKQAATPRAAPQSMIALNVIDVTPLRVVVTDGKERHVVRIGERLPGGAVFMGYDEQTRDLKTDRGMIQIPG